MKVFSLKLIFNMNGREGKIYNIVHKKIHVVLGFSYQGDVDGRLENLEKKVIIAKTCFCFALNTTWMDELQCDILASDLP